MAEVMIALSMDSRDAVDKIATAAVTAGAIEPRKPQDHGFMYLRSFNDLDGHIWEVFWMDPKAVPPA